MTDVLVLREAMGWCMERIGGHVNASVVCHRLSDAAYSSQQNQKYLLWLVLVVFLLFVVGLFSIDCDNDNKEAVE